MPDADRWGFGPPDASDELKFQSTWQALEATFAEHAPHVALYKASESDAAMKLALDRAERNDLICATGSLYLAGEVLRWAAAHGSKTAAQEIEGVDH